AQLFDNEQRRVRQLGQVNNLSVAVTAQLDSSANLRIAAAAVAAIFGIDHCGIVVSSDDRRAGMRVATHSAQVAAAGTQLRFPLPAQQLAALELRNAEINPDVAADPRPEAARHLLHQGQVTSLVLAP